MVAKEDGQNDTGIIRGKKEHNIQNEQIDHGITRLKTLKAEDPEKMKGIKESWEKS